MYFARNMLKLKMKSKNQDDPVIDAGLGCNIGVIKHPFYVPSINLND